MGHHTVVGHRLSFSVGTVGCSKLIWALYAEKDDGFESVRLRFCSWLWHCSQVFMDEDLARTYYGSESPGPNVYTLKGAIGKQVSLGENRNKPLRSRSLASWNVRFPKC